MNRGGGFQNEEFLGYFMNLFRKLYYKNFYV